MYTGDWKSEAASQKNFVLGNGGRYMGMVGITSKGKARCIFQIHSNRYIDSPLLEAYMDVDLTSASQAVFEGTQEIKVLSRSSLFAKSKPTQCTATLKFTLTDKNTGDPIPISSNLIKAVELGGSVQSSECDLDFTFTSWETKSSLLMALGFVAFEVGLITLGTFPLYKLLRTRSLSRIMILQEWVFLFNMMVDILLLSLNLTFSLRVLVDYFYVLSIISIALMFSILFKMRFFLYASQLRLNALNLNAAQLTRKKFISMIKFLVLGAVFIFCGTFFITYEFLFYIVFAYPLIQVVYNIKGVTQSNCFHANFHLPLFLPQLVYPIFLKGNSFSFFLLTPVYYFPVVLIAEVGFLVFFMFLQKTFGACFFLPNCLIPGYFNYFKKLLHLGGGI